MKAFLFSGQGSQKVGMGYGLFEKYPEYVKICDQVLGFSIVSLCLEDICGQQNQTKFTQPAVFVVNALSYIDKIENEPEPDFLAGHSLGEYNALFAAGVFTFEDTLKLVKKRGELMGAESGGSMLAVFEGNADKLQGLINDERIVDVFIANYNSPNQIVLSGKKEGIKNAKTVFEKEEIAFSELNVSGAFHSIFMQNAKEIFSDFINKYNLNSPKIPVVSNVTARPYEKHRIRELVLDQMIKPVNWRDSIKYMINDGVCQFEQVGSGKTLIKFLNQIKKEAVMS